MERVRMSEEEQREDTATEAAHVVLTDTGRSKAEAFRSTHKTQVLTILLTDLENSTAQQSELGNVRAFEITAEHRQVFRDLLANFDGEEVETAGDSFLIVFAAPSEGVRFALHMQAAMRQARETTPELPRVRCGLHQGQIVVERHESSVTRKAMDIYGIQISIAARITDLAGGGKIFCTRNVGDDARAILRADELAGLEEVTWRNHGPYGFKGVENTYEVCEVGEGPHAPLEAPPETLKSWPATHGEEIPGWRPSVGIVVPETNWRLEEKLGEGQFGEVWMAYNASNKAQQVFKFTFKRAQVSALKREARLLHRLKEYRHPALVEVYDVTEGDRPPHYLEMEYVDGPTMAEWIATDPPLEHRIELIARVAEVLEVAHQARIYHRDIKPANILLQRREDGSVLPKLADFGVGAAEDADLLKTLYASKTEHRAGTWDYIAPELKAEAVAEDGHRPRATAQSDLYALGLTLYQLITGDLQSLPGPGWEGNIPTDELREDIAACMANDPKQRPASGSQLAQQLRQHAQRAQARRIQRLRRIVFVAAAVAVLALGIAAFSGYQWMEAQEQRRVAEGERAEARRQLYHSSILQVTTHLDDRRFDLARAAFWQAPVEHSGWEWGHLAQLIYPSLAVLEGHEGGVTSASFSPDGTRIVTASWDATARVWDANTGEELFILVGHNRGIESVAFSPDGSRIATGSWDKTARIWNADSGEELHVLDRHSDQVSSVAFSPTGKLIVTGSGDNTARVWTVDSGEEMHILEGHMDAVTSAAFSPDGTKIVTGAWDNTGRIWDVESGNPISILFRHHEPINLVVFGPDSSQIASISLDGTAMLWDGTTGNIAQVFRGHEEPPRGSLAHAAFSPDGQRIVTASYDGTARVWDAFTGECLLTLEGHRDFVNFVDFTSDGEIIVTASSDNTARLWNSNTGEALRELEGHTDSITTSVFNKKNSSLLTGSSDGTARIWRLEAEFAHQPKHRPSFFTVIPSESVLVAGDWDRSIRIWDLTTGCMTQSFAGHHHDVNHIAISPDGTLIASSSKDRTARVWSISENAPMLTLEGHRDSVSSACFSPDGAILATSSWDLSTRLWDMSTGDVIHILETPTHHFQSDDSPYSPSDDKSHHIPRIRGYFSRSITSTFSPDGAKLLTIAGEKVARIWDISTGDQLISLQGHTGRVTLAKFSSNGLAVLTSAKEDMRVWDADTGEVLHLLKGHEAQVHSASFSPDGTRIVTASFDSTARVWDVNTGASLQVLEGHEGWVYGAAFSLDGARIVTASEDGTARLWDAATGAVLLVLEGHDDWLKSANFSTDGLRIVTASDDGTARIWTAAPWRLEDLPPVEGVFDTPEEERKARFFEWKRQEYQRWLAGRRESP